MSKLKYNIVVGGGIAGIVTAYYLLQKGKKVLLLEASNKLGGLLNSKNINDNYFDCGTHLLRETGIEHLDEFLYRGLEVDRFEYLKTGSFYKSLFTSNGFVSYYHLGLDVKENCFKELLEASKQHYPVAENLEQQLIQLFGKSYYKYIFKGIINKLFFKEASALLPDSHLLFGLGRLIAGNSEETNILKCENPIIDSLLGYHSYKQGISRLKSMYPKQGGAGAWVTLLENKLIELDTLIIKNAKFKVSLLGDRVDEFNVQDKKFAIENLYCTVPPIFLYNALGIEKPQIAITQRLTSVIVDILYSGDYLTDLFYIQNYDPAFKSFRITLYDNYNKTQKSGKIKRLTVEFLFNNEIISNEFIGYIAKDELVKMKVVDDITKLEIVNTSIIKGGFPIPTPQFKLVSETLINELSHISNLTFFGKASGKNWFMNDVIQEIHNHFKK